MERLNRDVYIAILLLVLCGVFFWASFDIREPDYGTLPPSAWPRVILAVLTLLSLIYLFQSLRRGPDTAEEDDEEPAPKGLGGWLAKWRNVLWCFLLFFAYLASLPVLGMLIGGVLFVFLLLNVLGGWEVRRLAFHATVAVIAIGSMWSLFTFGLGVILPPGIIFSPF